MKVAIGLVVAAVVGYVLFALAKIKAAADQGFHM